MSAHIMRYGYNSQPGELGINLPFTPDGHYFFSTTYRACMTASTASLEALPQTTIYLEGNIGAGKTTLLTALAETLTKEEKLKHNFTFQFEPLREWTNVAGCDLLTSYYRQPHRWAFTLNIHILNTLLTREKNAYREAPGKHCLMERSGGATKHVFVPYAHSVGYLTDWEFEIFNTMNCFCSAYHDIGLVGKCPTSTNRASRTLYLRTPPEVCF